MSGAIEPACIELGLRRLDRLGAEAEDNLPDDKGAKALRACADRGYERAEKVKNRRDKRS